MKLFPRHHLITHTTTMCIRHDIKKSKPFLSFSDSFYYVSFAIYDNDYEARKIIYYYRKSSV